MTRIDFYLLGTADPHIRRVTACRLIEKAFRQGHRIYLHTGSEDETRTLDDLLWTFRQGSFVPHEPCVGTSVGPDAPVLVGHAGAPAEMSDVLVNFGAEVPAGFERFERLAELVDQDAAVKQAGRRRYKFYQDRGHPIQIHHLDQDEKSRPPEP